MELFEEFDPDPQFHGELGFVVLFELPGFLLGEFDPPSYLPLFADGALGPLDPFDEPEPLGFDGESPFDGLLPPSYLPLLELGSRDGEGVEGRLGEGLDGDDELPREEEDDDGRLGEGLDDEPEGRELELDELPPFPIASCDTPPKMRPSAHNITRNFLLIPNSPSPCEEKRVKR